MMGLKMEKDSKNVKLTGALVTQTYFSCTSNISVLIEDEKSFYRELSYNLNNIRIEYDTLRPQHDTLLQKSDTFRPTIQ
jgi:hypothetical protein